jgi:putative transposase
MMARYDPLKHHRHSIRLKGYDYGRAGAYFVTTVNQGRLCVYGEIVNGEMFLNAAGQMIEKWWLELNHKFPTIETDAYVVIPNHFHGIIIITDDAGETAVGADLVGADLRVRPAEGEGGHIGPPLPKPPLPDAPQSAAIAADADETGVGADLRVRPDLRTIMQWFKTMTTNEHIRGVKTLGWPPFDRKLWQRDYYERILRNADELDHTRQYIADNPLRWDQDDENPAVIASGTWPGAQGDLIQ